mmetsp:Transcript_13326/g.36831  ORF Transcript_13326/g.36831 Transcript_13326/m.36831 type:complete len:119 (-) Transcript_13326:201-557(-)
MPPSELLSIHSQTHGPRIIDGLCSIAVLLIFRRKSKSAGQTRTAQSSSGWYRRSRTVVDACNPIQISSHALSQPSVSSADSEGCANNSILSCSMDTNTDGLPDFSRACALWMCRQQRT